MNVVLLLCLLAVVIATYLSSLNLSLLGLSRSALQRRLDEKGRPNAADWLHEQLPSATLATALLRTFARMSIYILVLAEVVNLRTEAMITWPVLILSGVLAGIVIWFSTIVLGSAIARHAGTGVIACSLPFLRAVTWLCTPFTTAGLMIDEMVRRIAAADQNADPAEAGLLQSIEDVQREGSLDIQSAEILENVVEFTNTEVSEIMTPRTDIEGIELTDDLALIRDFIRHAGHSRIPVYRESLDHIAGILYVKDLIRYLGEEAENFKLQEHLRQPIVVPQTKSVKDLLTDFQHSEVHMAIVIDEYGGTAGLVTIEDVLEEIVGDIRDEHEPAHETNPTMLSLDDHCVEVDGRFRIGELNARLSLELPDEDDFDTIGGFVLWHLGRVPIVGESFEAHGARLDVIAAAPTHVQRVRIELLEPAGSAGEPRSSAGAA